MKQGFSNAVGNMLNNGVTNLPIGTTTYNGGAANAQNAANLINQASGGQGTLQQSTHPYDPVGRVVGGNSATQNDGNTGIFDAITLKPHSGYGKQNPMDSYQPWEYGKDSVPVIIQPKR